MGAMPLPDSTFAALRPREAGPLGIDDARRALSASGLPVVRFTPSGERSVPGALWQADVVLDRGDGATSTLRVACAPSPPQAAHIAATLRGAFDLLPEDVEATRSSATSVHVVTQLAESIFDLHDLLRIVSVLAPDLTVLLDVEALAARSRDWVLEAARTKTPPAPESLFSLHAVGDTQGLWLHTHGLARLGILELDACAVPREDARGIADMINTAAKYFLERGVPPADEPFEVARGMPIVWLPWERGVAHVGRAGGGAHDRHTDDHRGERGILFAKTRGFFGGTKYVSLAHWSSALAGHPVFFFSDLETARAASLAAERLPRFVQIQRRYGGQPGWRFLVKLGYTIDGAREALDREHLWFDVHNLEGERVEATCLNQPHRVSALREGLRGTHELSRLSGFTILCPQGSFDAERIDVLERALSR